MADSVNSGLSTEALLTLLSILVMIILSGLRIAWKNGPSVKVHSIRRKIWKPKNTGHGA
jgi:hypothetical protein